MLVHTDNYYSTVVIVVVHFEVFAAVVVFGLVNVVFVIVLILETYLY